MLPQFERTLSRAMPWMRGPAAGAPAVTGALTGELPIVRLLQGTAAAEAVWRCRLLTGSLANLTPEPKPAKGRNASRFHNFWSRLRVPLP